MPEPGLEDYVACEGGLLDGQWFSLEEWAARVETSRGTHPPGVTHLYQPTGRRIENPGRFSPRASKLVRSGITAEVYTRGGAR